MHARPGCRVERRSLWSSHFLVSIRGDDSIAHLSPTNPGPRFPTTVQILGVCEVSIGVCHGPSVPKLLYIGGAIALVAFFLPQPALIASASIDGTKVLAIKKLDPSRRDVASVEQALRNDLDLMVESTQYAFYCAGNNTNLSTRRSRVFASFGPPYPTWNRRDNVEQCTFLPPSSARRSTST